MAGIDALKAVVSTPTATRIHRHFQETAPADAPLVTIS
jgi:hypothetical protein